MVFPWVSVFSPLGELFHYLFSINKVVGHLVYISLTVGIKIALFLMNILFVNSGSHCLNCTWMEYTVMQLIQEKRNKAQKLHLIWLSFFDRKTGEKPGKTSWRLGPLVEKIGAQIMILSTLRLQSRPMLRGSCTCEMLQCSVFPATNEWSEE